MSISRKLLMELRTPKAIRIKGHKRKLTRFDNCPKGKKKDPTNPRRCLDLVKFARKYKQMLMDKEREEKSKNKNIGVLGNPINPNN